MDATMLRRLDEANERLSMDVQHDACLIEQLKAEIEILQREFEESQTALVDTKTELTRLAALRHAEQAKLYYTTLLQDELESRHHVSCLFSETIGGCLNTSCSHSRRALNLLCTI